MTDHPSRTAPGAHAAAQPRRRWPLAVRLARPADRAAVLEFASRTWDGWDYVPHAWPVWLAADDGVLLVAAPGAPADGSPAIDREGRSLEVGRPVAVARVALVADREAWLEGIRVDPRVRGMDVATDLQVAELEWAAAQRVGVVRYATGESNEGSHRLGARHGFRLLAALRTYWWAGGGEDEDDEDGAQSGFDDGARADATVLRRRTLDRLAEAGVVAPPEAAGAWWRRVSEDPTFAAGARLYEHRAWALQELTEERFRRHVERGEVLAWPGTAGAAQKTADWALAILEREALPSEDVSLHLGLLAGDGGAALRLVSAVRAAAERSIRFRLPADDAPLLRARQAEFAAAGFRAREWTLHILGRPLDGDNPPPAPSDPSLLLLEDRPAATVRPPC